MEMYQLGIIKEGPHVADYVLIWPERAKVRPVEIIPPGLQKAGGVRPAYPWGSLVTVDGDSYRSTTRAIPLSRELAAARAANESEIEGES